MPPFTSENVSLRPFASLGTLEDATSTAVLAASKASLFARQATATVTVTADNRNGNGNGNDTSTLTGGAVAGIVIGSVVGILLLIWVVRSCFSLGAPPGEREGLYHDIEPKRHRHHSRHHSRPRRYSRTSEVSMPAPVIVTDTGRASSGQRQPTYYCSDDGRGRRYKRSY
ncbi:hypothetical protein ED733_004128 [Metarhizium rileyi]|uniref:Uncharacterized protein n=1 Tax=Metarhizium rileyi (strain RCEF 4871) TaxID=1649241 RepID=A0A5C6G7Y4_METRR|nr:hypothetical protein ED733_004128 [Metarhizium rileyi]